MVSVAFFGPVSRPVTLYALQPENRASLPLLGALFIRFHGIKHPRDMGAPAVEAFLTMLASHRKVPASTHNQALRALPFLYRQVLDIELLWLENINRPNRPQCLPSVRLLAPLLYGIGMRLMEALRLRNKDVEFDRHVIIIREAKGGKDRVVMLSRGLESVLKRKSQQDGPFRNRIGKHSRPALSCRSHWRRNIQMPVRLGRGFGCSL